MVGLGTRTTIERVEIGNSQPKAARASALPDRLSDSNRTILAAKELRHIAQTLVRHLINHRFDVTLY